MEDSLHLPSLEEVLRYPLGKRAYNQQNRDLRNWVQLHTLEVPADLPDVLVIDKHTVTSEAGLTVSVIEVGINLQLQYGVEIPAADHPRLHDVDACLTVQPGKGKSFQTLLNHLPFRVSYVFCNACV